MVIVPKLDEYDKHNRYTPGVALVAKKTIQLRPAIWPILIFVAATKNR
ncbi:hypothetical protein DSUL_20571 [Desulfovibrionales bacterium]